MAELSAPIGSPAPPSPPPPPAPAASKANEYLFSALLAGTGLIIFLFGGSYYIVRAQIDKYPEEPESVELKQETRTYPRRCALCLALWLGAVGAAKGALLLARRRRGGATAAAGASAAAPLVSTTETQSTQSKIKPG